ncbi:hypothetical protein VP01_4476g1 [Puccinia sorghi]|uniref:Uncharacterized protein n=1 Tax=Puccinia sorghi TaxID=27349 RepID=A0A0L6UP98_9BASI|nr:hypothetical protein VP01_4476g1 [Puccinia sorghi]
MSIVPPANMKFCTCSRCAASTSSNPQQPISGKYISAQNFDKHRYSEHSSAFCGFDENEGSFHLGEFSINKSVYIVMFVSWLHIFCNVSRENCKTAINTLFNIIKAILRQSSSNQLILKMPRNPQTLLSRVDVDSNLTQTICCQAFFKLYPDLCNKALFIQKKTHGGIKDFGLFLEKSSKIMPINYCVSQCLLFSQSISNWLKWLFSIPNIERTMEMWAHEINKIRQYSP